MVLDITSIELTGITQVFSVIFEKSDDEFEVTVIVTDYENMSCQEISIESESLKLTDEEDNQITEFVRKYIKR